MLLCSRNSAQKSRSKPTLAYLAQKTLRMFHRVAGERLRTKRLVVWDGMFPNWNYLQAVEMLERPQPDRPVLIRLRNQAMLPLLGDGSSRAWALYCYVRPHPPRSVLPHQNRSSSMESEALQRKHCPTRGKASPIKLNFRFYNSVFYRDEVRIQFPCNSRVY